MGQALFTAALSGTAARGAFGTVRQRSNELRVQMAVLALLGLKPVSQLAGQIYRPLGQARTPFDITSVRNSTIVGPTKRRHLLIYNK